MAFSFPCEQLRAQFLSVRSRNLVQCRLFFFFLIRVPLKRAYIVKGQKRPFVLLKALQTK